MLIFFVEILDVNICKTSLETLYYFTSVLLYFYHHQKQADIDRRIYGKEVNMNGKKENKSFKIKYQIKKII